jgi:hypothetical protein
MMEAGKALLAKAWAETDKLSSKSLNAYLDRVLIDIPPKPRRFGDVMEWWQVERNKVIVPAFEFVAGLNPTYAGPKKFWLEYSKGTDKSSYLARLLNWLLAYSKKSLRCYVGAKDKAQADGIKDFMLKESEHNKGWLKRYLEFKGNSVTGKTNGSVVHFVTSDGAGEQGKTPDLVLCEELTHWESDGLFNALWSAIPKRQGYAVGVILTNAGFIGSWQEKLRQLAQEQHGKGWHFFAQTPNTTLASWMTEDKISEEARLMSPLEADRLFRNRWIDPAEAGIKLFSPSDIDRCIGVPEPPPPGAQIVLSVDYGGICDRTALTVLWYNTDTQVIHVVSQTVWAGSPVNEIRIKDVESWLALQFSLYPNAVAVIDTLGQMLGTAQEFEDKGHKIIRFQYRGGKQNALMLTTLRSFLTNQRIRFAPDCGMLGNSTLATELKEVVGKPMVYGERIDHKAGFHDDLTVSLGMGVLAAVMHTVPGSVPQKKDPEEETRRMPRPLLSNPFERQHAQRRGLFGLHLPHS